MRMDIKKEVKINIGEVTLDGSLFIPNGARSIVVFSHGSGSSRLSPRNNFVATVLNKEKIATLLIDLLTEDEDSRYENHFNMELLANRLVLITEYLLGQHELKNFKIGYFGASTGAASALKAAVKLSNHIGAVVSRGGRPDLAGPLLHFVTAPVLLIVGSDDLSVVNLNEEAYHKLECLKKIEIVKGATHLFEEPGKLEEVARLATKWFKIYLAEKKIESTTNTVNRI